MESVELQEIVGSLPDRVTAVLKPGAQVVVTGCAGFVGSTVTEALLELGCRVTGVDCLTDYYDIDLKHENMSGFKDHADFTWVKEDLQTLDAVALLSGQVACFHLAAQAGVRASWGEFFNEYLGRNVMATQRLLEACRHPEVKSSLVRLVPRSAPLPCDRATLQEGCARVVGIVI